VRFTHKQLTTNQAAGRSADGIQKAACFVEGQEKTELGGGNVSQKRASNTTEGEEREGVAWTS